MNAILYSDKANLEMPPKIAFTPSFQNKNYIGMHINEVCLFKQMRYVGSKNQSKKFIRKFIYLLTFKTSLQEKSC